MQAFVVMRLILVEVSSRMNTNKSRGRPVSTLLAYYQLVPPLQGNDWTSCRYPGRRVATFRLYALPWASMWLPHSGRFIKWTRRKNSNAAQIGAA